MLRLLAVFMLLAQGALAGSLRVALFDTDLSRKSPGALLRAVEKGEDDQLRAVVSVLAAVDADVLVLGGIDQDRGNLALRGLGELIGAKVAGYPHAFSVPGNSGRTAGIDLDGDNEVTVPQDALGWGLYRGQNGLGVLSRMPLNSAATRDFSDLLWRDFGSLPRKPDGAPYYSDEAWSRLPLPSRAIFCISVELPQGDILQILVAHAPTPVFDGPEDRNGMRNAAVVRLLAEAAAGRPLTDSKGLTAPLAAESLLVAGFLSVDPVDGEGDHGAIAALLSHPDLGDPRPTSAGGGLAADDGINRLHLGDPALDTADWRDRRGPGNLRVDYLLPARNLTVLGSGVFWPAPGDPLAETAVTAARHRVVWIDLEIGN